MVMMMMMVVGMIHEHLGHQTTIHAVIVMMTIMMTIYLHLGHI